MANLKPRITQRSIDLMENKKHSLEILQKIKICIRCSAGKSKEVSELTTKKKFSMQAENAVFNR